MFCGGRYPNAILLSQMVEDVVHLRLGDFDLGTFYLKTTQPGKLYIWLDVKSSYE